MKAWDLSGGKLIVLEAGAEYGFFADNLRHEHQEIRGYANLAGNPKVFPQMLAILDERTEHG